MVRWFFFFFCNVQSHDFEFKEEESNFAKNIGTYLELISEVKNEFLKSEIAKDNGYALSTLRTI